MSWMCLLRWDENEEEMKRWKGYFCRHTERKLTGCGQRIECENVRRGLMQTCIRILRFYMHFGCVRFHWTSVTAEHRLTIFRTHWHGFECAAWKNTRNVRFDLLIGHVGRGCRRVVTCGLEWQNSRRIFGAVECIEWNLLVAGQRVVNLALCFDRFRLGDGEVTQLTLAIVCGLNVAPIATVARINCQ